MKNKNLALPIVEIFYSLQGEGPMTGAPSVFVRLWGCNRKCNFCDTKESWEENSDTRLLTLTKIIEEVVKKKEKARNLVITGGEPLLHQENNSFNLLLRWAKTNGFHIEVETNGSICPSKDTEELVDQFNVSPKIMLESELTSFKLFRDNPKAVFKFLVADNPEFVEVVRFISSLGISREKVWLMPKGKTLRTQLYRLPLVAELCKESGYKLCVRTHILIWDGEKGR